MMSPGNYLARRRHAAGLSIADVVAVIVTEPRYAEIDRRGWLERIERDIASITPDVIAALQSVYPFSSSVLRQLMEARSYGPPFKPPRLCIICACSHFDPCLDHNGVGCAWSHPSPTTASAPAAPPRNPPSSA